jgi:hypothetical protein
VRRQARLSLTQLAGRDVGGEGDEASERWRKHFRAGSETKVSPAP